MYLKNKHDVEMYGCPVCFHLFPKDFDKANYTVPDYIDIVIYTDSIPGQDSDFKFWTGKNEDRSE